MKRSHALMAGAVTLLLAACGWDTAEPQTSTRSPEVTFATDPPSPSASPTPPTSTPGPAPTTTLPLGDPVVTLQPFVNTAGVVDIAVRPGDSAVYLVRQEGDVLRVDPTSGSNETVLDIDDLTNGGGERGLLGLAFHPTEALAYVNYTRASGGDTVIAEYRVDGSGTFDTGSRRELLTIDQPYSNHNGGGVVFGPDGYLYIGTGDGGSADDPRRLALNLTSLLGKMLRIDVAAAGDQPYTVPADNPFVGIDGVSPEIWGVGLRNPWRYTFDPATGDLWIADVGQNRLEEVNRSAADASGVSAGRGVNYGWSAFEASDRFNDDQPPDGATPPIFQYPHGDLGCSISGGAIYRGAAIPALVGWYVYGDYCSGSVRAIRAAIDADGDTDGDTISQVTLAQSSAVVAVKPGPDGELYVASIDGGVFRVDGA